MSIQKSNTHSNTEVNECNAWIYQCAYWPLQTSLVTSAHVRLQNSSMYAVAAFGLLTIIFGLMMIISPSGWSQGILSYSRKTYFHAAEVISRLLVGGTLVFFAAQTMHPKIIGGVGYLLIIASVFLVVAGEKRHRAFAVSSATFGPIFRPVALPRWLWVRLLFTPHWDNHSIGSKTVNCLSRRKYS